MVQQGSKATVVKKPKELVAFFTQHKNALSKFISEHPSQEYKNSEQQFIAFVKYLNSLLK